MPLLGVNYSQPFVGQIPNYESQDGQQFPSVFLPIPITKCSTLPTIRQQKVVNDGTILREVNDFIKFIAEHASEPLKGYTPDGKKKKKTKAEEL